MKESCYFQGLRIEPDDIILITNPRGKKITIENIYGKLDFKGSAVSGAVGPMMRCDFTYDQGVFMDSLVNWE